ncbi:SpoIIE family protein phosphatase [Frankia sp. Cppng1_Ct_nod]|uniref:SpoIIE family protein phosphatase n=1 Tax=Frankia sp. Cppng1_Ct_nod TaxID=2897162 RepID=UPI0010418576|nr:SpoIIE family protein phosphatase [Frankia sp. Cppng1_Ct_nod]
MNLMPQPGGQVPSDLRTPRPGWPVLPTSDRWEEATLFSQIFDAAPIILSIIDRGRRIRAVNQAWVRAFGLSAENAVGRRVSELFPDLDPVNAELDHRVMATGEAIIDDEVTTAMPADPSDRRVLRVCRYPLHDSAGARVAMGVAAVDVTEQRRAEAERDAVERRLRLLSRASGLLGASLDLSATLREIVTLVVPEFADTCELYLADEPYPLDADPDPLMLRRVVWAHSPDLPRPPPDLDLPQSGEMINVAGRSPEQVFVTRQPIRIDIDDRLFDTSPAPRVAAVIRHFRLRSSIVVPLLAGGEYLGSAGFGVTAARPYDEGDVQTAAELGSRIASAIANARAFDHQRIAALTLQRALMPRDIPAVGGLELAWRYQPGTSGTEVGGDWFDVLPLRAGRVALVIGDVMGRGLGAAAAMGQLRTTVRTLARLDLPPAAVMTELEAVTRSIETIASVVYVVRDPANDTLTMVNGGHLPPALRHPDGTVELLGDVHGIILGVDEQTFTETRHRFPAGSTLALYTDGLVESPAIDIDEGCRRLLRILSETADLSATADRLLTLINPSGGYDDDVTLLLARTRPDHRGFA